jgi:hypothetical protein
MSEANAFLEHVSFVSYDVWEQSERLRFYRGINETVCSVKVGSPAGKCHLFLASGLQLTNRNQIFIKGYLFLGLIAVIATLTCSDMLRYVNT